jgi:membrane fusion protein (multidrug efflux system)
MTEQDALTSAGKEAASGGTPRRKKVMLKVAGFFALVAIGYGTYWTLYARYFEETDNAYVQGNVVQITPQISGTVARIMVDDTDLVKPGQQLLKFDTMDEDVALAQAEAQLGEAVRAVRALHANDEQLAANVTLRESELARTRDDLERRKALAGTGAVSDEEIRHAELTVTTAKAAVAVARGQLIANRALIEGTDVANHPNILRAAAHVREMLLAQSRTTLFAPVGGVIARRNAQVGQRLAPGAPVMAIVPLDQLWVDANFKEAQLRNIRVNQPVTLVADLYGGKVRYDGRVVGLAAGTGAAFSLLPAQNATGNWVKVIQRIPVRIALDPKQVADHPLRIGLSMTVQVDVHDQQGTQVARVASRGSALIAYAAALDPGEGIAKTRIAAIIAANLK